MKTQALLMSRVAAKLGIFPVIILTDCTMASGLGFISLIATTSGATMAIGIYTRAIRPVGDNLIMAIVLLVAGLLLALRAFYCGDRSTLCKVSLGISTFLLLCGGLLLLAISASVHRMT